MTDTVICYVQQKNGKPRKYKSKDGANFTDMKGFTYNAPVQDAHEILTLKTFWGEKRLAFYIDGHQNAYPLGEKGAWKKTSNHDSDVDILIRVTAAALMEANLADLKANASLLGIGTVGFGLLLHHFLG